jgi:hypothetical protein
MPPPFSPIDHLTEPIDQSTLERVRRGLAALETSTSTSVAYDTAGSDSDTPLPRRR